MVSDKPTSALKQKHPKGLKIIFFTEMWERFGYYGMLSVFTLYLVKHFKMDEGDASGVYANYIALAYLTALLGGFVADRLLGYRKAVLLGAALLSIGYYLLAFDSRTIMYLAVYVILPLGHGFFKPNQTTQVGNLYPQGDPRKDSAFSIFYMAINVGAFLSPIGIFVVGMLTESWSMIFLICGIGMTIGFIINLLCYKELKVVERPSSVAAVLDVPLPKEFDDQREPPKVEKERLRTLFIMCGIVVLFWMAFHQNGSSMTFFAENNIDMSFNGKIKAFEELQKQSKDSDKIIESKEDLNAHNKKTILGAALFQTINPLCIVLFTPLVLAIFSYLRKRGKEPATPTKIGIGMLLTGASFAILVFASLAGGDTGRVSPFWMIGCYAIITIGELCLSPMGLSMVTKLAPRRMTGLMFGVWNIAIAVGNKLCGLMGKLWKPLPHHTFFLILVGTSLLAAALLFPQLKRLNRSMPQEKTV